MHSPQVLASFARHYKTGKTILADLVARENAEIAVLQGYLPAQLAEAELEKLILEAISASGAASIKDMGKVMAIVKPKVQGRAEMGAVSARNKQKLG